jgi:hypothetical protein
MTKAPAPPKAATTPVHRPVAPTRDEQDAQAHAGAVSTTRPQFDLSKIRIHADDAADRMTTAHDARAVTRGHDIYFRRDEWQPGTIAGNRLIAHELAHVEQQERRGAVETHCAPDDQPVATSTATPTSPTQTPSTDDIMVGDHVQQRRALFGAATADELIETNGFLQAQLSDLADRFGSTTAVAMVHDKLDLVLFRGGAGVVALENLVHAEAALVKKLRKKKTPEVQAEVAKLRKEHADAFAADLATLIATVVDAVSKPRPITSGAKVGGEPSGLAAVKAAIQPEAILETVSEGVSPGDSYQQRVALMGAASAEEIIDLDPEFRAKVRAVARTYAAVEGKSAAEAAGTTAAAAYELVHGKLPPGVRTYRYDELSADETRRAAEYASMETTVEQRYVELRSKFIKWGGRVLFERSVGGTALAKLAAAEKAIALAHKKDRVGLGHEILLTRQEHASRFAPKLAFIKEQFVATAVQRFRFMHESQPGVKPAYEMERLPDNAEPAFAIDVLDGLITAGKDEGDLEVAESVINFVRELNRISDVPIGASTYRTHSWGRYSIDLFPSIKKDEAGYYDQDAVVNVFRKINDAAETTNVRWRALYTDFDTAKRVNAMLKRIFVNFQWEHGPDPYVLHIHLDIMPRDVDVP